MFKIIEKFHKQNINLTKIESRPKKNSIWEYNFYLDFEGNRNEQKIAHILEEIKESTTMLKILGSYPVAKML